MSKIEVAAASLFGKASKGDVNAIKLLMSLKAEADVLADASAEFVMSPEDSEVLIAEADWLAFVQKTHAEADGDETE